MNFKLMAIKISDEIKDIPQNNINRIAEAIFDFDCSDFENENITSIRAQEFYDWIMTLNEQPILMREKIRLLKEYVFELTPEDHSARDIINRSCQKECEDQLKKLGIAISNIKGAIGFISVGSISESEDKYIKSFQEIEQSIEFLEEICDIKLKHLNFYENYEDLLVEGINEQNVDHYLKKWYEPLENEVRALLNPPKTVVKEEREDQSQEILDNESDVKLIEKILRNFNTCAMWLKNHRRKDHEAFILKDEYDVHDLIYSFLVMLYPDAETEDPSSKVAGISGRTDITIKSKKLIIEIKYLKNWKDWKAMLTDIHHKIQTYSQKEGYDQMIVFIYNPDGAMKNPDEIEKTLSKEDVIGGKKFKTTTIIIPH